MADKEATVYIVDVGASMGQKHNTRDVSDLDWALTYIWDRITSTVATERKTLTLGVVGLRTEDTLNELSESDGFHNLTVFQPIGQLLLPDLKTLKRRLAACDTESGDAISAIVLAITLINNYTKKLKYTRKIVLVTNARGSVDPDGISDIATKLKGDHIDLLVIGVDFDDPEYGFKEEDKDAQKAKNESVLRQLADECDGVFGTVEQAIAELAIPRLTTTKPIPSFKGDFTLGSTKTYDTALCINVERYPRVMVRRPMAARSLVQSSAQSAATLLSDVLTQDGGHSKGDVTDANAIPRTYVVLDDSVDGGKRDVTRDDLAKGYEYGRSIVPISDSEFDITKLETEAGLQIVGFVPWTTYDRFMSMSVSNVVVGQKANPKAALALSSLIHALYELESYAVARLVTKADKEPSLCLLAPSIEVDYECLLDLQLPFAEDARSYKFPPLDRVITVLGNKITEHKNLPSQDLQTAMDEYVDQMDLSHAAKDDEGNDCEYLNLAENYSPVLHRIEQAVRWRAVHHDRSIPPIPEILTRNSKPPTHLIEETKAALEKLAAVANVKKVPNQKLSRKRARDEIKPLSGLNVNALLQQPFEKVKITANNAIPDFKKSLDQSSSAEDVRNAARQLGKIIEQQIKDSFADRAYESAIEKMGVLRDEMIDTEEPDSYNDFLRDLKSKITAEQLNGNRMEMWHLIRRRRLGLITKAMAPVSSVDEDEAKAFF